MALSVDTEVDEVFTSVTQAGTDAGAVFMLGYAPADSSAGYLPDLSNITYIGNIDATSATSQSISFGPTTLTAGLWWALIGAKTSGTTAGTQPKLRGSPEGALVPITNGQTNGGFVLALTRTSNTDLDDASQAHIALSITTNNSPIIAFSVSDLP